jgi:anti-sigma regulatory factor (Ser/Thr protein kinase)
MSLEAGVRTEVEGTYRFAPEPESVPTARRLARDYATASMSEEQCGKLDLAVTEIVSNAVRHSGADDEIVLALAPKDGYLCVRVTDGGTGLVPQPGAMATEPGAGFGLFLVEQLTRRWGITREGGKTRVWFELDFAAKS